MDDRFWTNVHRHWQGLVAAYENHPSVLMYCIENEMNQRTRLNILENTSNTNQITQEDGAIETYQARWLEVGQMVKQIDPGRPITYSGGGDINGLTETYNIHYPRPFTLDMRFPQAAYWLEEDPPIYVRRDHNLFEYEFEQPLLVGEFGWSRQVQMPLGASVFIGDRAYDETEYAYGWRTGLKWQADGYRYFGVGINPWYSSSREKVGELYPPIELVCREFDTHFWAEETVNRRLVVLNEILADSDLRLEVQLTVNSRSVSRQSFVLPMKAATKKEMTVALNMPKVDQRSNGEIEVTLYRNQVLERVHRMPVSIFPRQTIISSTTAKGILLFDPSGETYEALTQRGLALRRVRTLSSAELASTKTLWIGKHAAVSAKASLIDAFVAKGGKVVVFEQAEAVPYLPAQIDTAHDATITFLRGTNHPLLTGIRDDDFKFWRGDHLVSTSTYRRPQTPHLPLAMAGGSDGVVWSPLLIVPQGQGEFVLSQLQIIDKLATEPIAQTMLQNLLDYSAARPTPAVQMAFLDEQGGILRDRFLP
ncbi:MAG: hypothetical protein AAF804_16975, partial [Bacteroidota bacterium]